ncbi:tRNA preQ1(34) S-adenosylmethionine ribosyltransferase-isomerase QueA [Malaciobacter molluscorum]|uniref:tRNA preQ1(34) S-adenosylmethionine ribosyltransferase-isomerase QueA n=1 Tax=Malaciobacter molluscorum TaxID=1032072 RepID=UPI00100A5E84|nr:tRNA preQ1(34) S-adenosylmethionine ribosyltransferase-isomerase QueA [Malaciobacter molluscorum]RXJ97287.1 tRNA preQ1(34) S-adenosylmethionine ribosyltransferase-isomerase QueA [Malaciobacter molluscorum]
MKKNKLDPLKTSSYDYNLPKELIATQPVSPADNARLLVYDRKNDKITHTTFKKLLDFIPNDVSIFLNDTKVIKARIFGTKQSGGKIELLMNKPLFMNRFLVMIRGKVKIGTILNFEENLSAEVLEINEDGTRVVKFFENNNELEFLELVEILNKIGHLPLPPYMNREDKEEDNKNYQTLFAKNYGAVAAPTASLHFTPELLKKLEDKFNIEYLTLHVGAGTFKPVDVEDILNHPMHSEYFEISAKAKKELDNAKKVLAVGTTVTRTVEYYARTNKIQGECDLFLNPSNTPIKVDHLLTNFHLPKSTLIMLIASFVGLEKTLEIYKEAIKEKYRFYSYGDGMLII